VTSLRQTLRKPGALATHSALQVLDLKYCDGASDLSFVRSLSALEELDVSRTKMADLSPLSGLPRLRTIAANLSPVRRLPTALTNLQELAILSSKVREADVKAFQDAHPQCHVKHGWADALLAALGSADRLQVRSGGTCHRNEAQEQTLFETADPAQIRSLRASIEVVDERSGFHCMCCGDPSLEFYRGDKLVATHGFHHGRGLRWIEGWPGDAALASKSAPALVDWLAARNVRGPSEQRAAEIELAQAGARKLTQAMTGMSPPLAEAFAAGPARFQAALARAIPDKKNQAAVWLRVLGMSNGSWSELDGIEQAAEDALKNFDAATLVSAASAALVGEDRQFRRGAARLWMSWQSSLENWKPSNVAELHRVVLQVQQQAYYYPLRMQALSYLAAWKEELPAEEVDRRLSAGLHDAAPQVRREAMLVAGRMKHTESIPLLVKVIEGEAIPTHPLADVSAWERSEVPEGFGDVAEGCSDKEVAALALGIMGDKVSKDLIERIAPPTAMTDVAVALLGEGQRLKPEHFRTAENNQELQLAAVEAVVRSKGRFGLKIAIDYQQATHWWEEESVAERLSRMLVAENAPGSRQLVGCKSLAELRRWFDRYGAEYLARS